MHDEASKVSHFRLHPTYRLIGNVGGGRHPQNEVRKIQDNVANKKRKNQDNPFPCQIKSNGESKVCVVLVRDLPTSPRVGYTHTGFF